MFKTTEQFLHNQGSSLHTGIQSNWGTISSYGVFTNYFATVLQKAHCTYLGEMLAWFLICYSEEGIG